MIVAGTIFLIQLNSSDTQETKESFVEIDRNMTVFSTTAGVADLLDTDLPQAVQRQRQGWQIY